MTDFTTPDAQCPKPTSINGYRILRAALAPARKGEQRFHVILVDRAPLYADADRFVVTDLCVGAKQWTQGSYISDYHDAQDAHLARCIRYGAK